MRRCTPVLVLAGGIASARAVCAQPRTMPVVGFLGNGSPDKSSWIVEAIHESLSDTGHVEGRNLAVE